MVNYCHSSGFRSRVEFPVDRTPALCFTDLIRKAFCVDTSAPCRIFGNVFLFV